MLPVVPDGLSDGAVVDETGDEGADASVFPDDSYITAGAGDVEVDADVATSGGVGAGVGVGVSAGVDESAFCVGAAVVTTVVVGGCGTIDTVDAGDTRFKQVPSKVKL